MVCAGIIDKLTVSRAGHFSCPILAGVIFIACCNPHGCRPSEDSGDVKHAVMVRNRLVLRRCYMIQCEQMP